jgi:hypothetical protein
METRHLAVAERNIGEGDARVEKQVELIERLRRRGTSTVEAEKFLRLLRETVAGWRRERRLILSELDRSRSA